ncbi:MAG: hypothetical protein ABS46_03985 [Cytophagaceae bacterium SCN 52-12]|nr:MAG: hypothetical protein ABS46_03985 [Cytophagaceae bacterium SCN 52-12]
MDDYRELKPEDLVEDPAFRAWVYHGTGAEAWNEWVNEHPDHAQAADLARNILASVRGELDSFPGSEVKNRVQRILESLDAGRSGTHPADRSANHRDRRLWWQAAAAGLVLAAGLGALIYTRLPEAPAEKKSVAFVRAPGTSDQTHLEIVNDSESPRLVNLPDGSSVLLKRASGIRFPRQFAVAKREVELSGEAFFEVKKNPEHPFFVYAGQMVTRVIGTSFTIRSYQSDATAKIRVKTGKVSVWAAETVLTASQEPSTGIQELVLEPNQQAEFSRSDLKFALLENDRPEVAPIPIEQMSFEFRRTAVSDVFEAIRTAYQVDIRYDAGLLRRCSVTASLGDEPLTEKLNMICEVIGATYREKNGKIYIEAGGCE